MSYYMVDPLEVYRQSIITVIVLIVIFMIIVMWKIFKKTGNKGWKCLIPIYSSIVEFKFLDISIWMISLVLLSNIVSGIAQVRSSTILNLISYVIELPVSILVSKKMAEKFRKSSGFAVGLFFLPIIFYPILAFGPAKYKKKTL